MPNINNKIIAKDIVIKSNDIQYKEGILEYLETDKEIDYIITKKLIILSFLKIYQAIFQHKI